MPRATDRLSLIGPALGVAVAAAAWDASFHVVPTATGAWKGITGAPGPLGIGAALLVGALAAALLSRVGTGVRRPFLALGLAAAPLVPVVTGALRPLLVFQGPVLRLLAGAVLAVAGVRLLRERATPIGDARPLALFAAAFCFYAAWSARVPGPAGPQGDEPHYLLITQSLLSDGDLDLGDELDGREYAAFYGGTLSGHISPNTPPGTRRSIHSPGFPALLLPAYAFGGYAGARLFMSALAALAGALVHRLVRGVTGREDVAAAAWALAVFTPPLPFYAVTLYPETLATLAIVAYLLLARAAPRPAVLATAAMLAAALPWAHTKFIPLGVLGLFFTLIRPYSWRARGAAVLAVAASLGGLLSFFHALYGAPSFIAALGPVDVDLRRIPWGTGGLFFDRQYGLLTVAAWLALAAAGLPALWRERTGDAVRALALALMPVIPAAAYVDWWGGACPPARYVLPVIGPLMLFAAAVLPSARTFAAAAGGAGLAVLGIAADVPRALRNRPDGESLLLRTLSPAVDLDGWLPSFVEGGAAAPLLALSLVAAGAIAWRWRGRGLVAAVVLYAVAVSVASDRPLVDQRVATERLLWSWDGAGSLRGLALPFELPRRPWTLSTGEIRNSRRMLLPPGAYVLRVRFRAPGAPASIHLVAHAGDLTLGEWDVDAQAGGAAFPLLLPAGGRGLGVTAIGMEGAAEVEEVLLVPEALVPAARRTGFDWPELARPDRYRLGADEVRVTVLDRSEPGDGAVCVRGQGALLVDAPSGATLVVRVVRDEASAGAITWGTRAVPLPAERETVLHLPMSEGAALGNVAVIPVRIQVAEACVSFALQGR